MRLIELAFCLAALGLTSALPDVSNFLKTSSGCKSLNCLLSLPEDSSPLLDGEPASDSASLVDVILQMNDDQMVPSFSATSSSSSSSPPFLNTARAAAERITGTTIDHFIPPRSFAASVPASTLAALEADPSMLSVTRLLPRHKFSLSNLRRFFAGAIAQPAFQPASVSLNMGRIHLILFCLC
jgi:hypothetical protein